MKIVIIGLSITSSWGNGHAVTYRGLVRELDRMGHDVVFLERDVPWYSSNRDLPAPPFCRAFLYQSIRELRLRFRQEIAQADLAIVGSYTKEGGEAGQLVLETCKGVRAFYDIDTPVTLAKLARGDHEYISPELVPEYDLYLSFTGGPTLDRLEREFGSPMARPLYCSADPETYFPEAVPKQWELGYLGTYSDDRQPALEQLLFKPAMARPKDRFVVAGPQYPDSIAWPDNVERIDHLPPSKHKVFYNAQRFALNVTRKDMIAAGWSPSVRLFEAGACAVPVISDVWPGIEEIFVPGEEIVLARCAEDVLRCLDETSSEEARRIGQAARERVMESHTPAKRAKELVAFAEEAASATNRPATTTASENEHSGMGLGQGGLLP